MSAIAESHEKNEPVQVLFCLQDGFDTVDYTGPMEVLSWARHDIKNPETRAFICHSAAKRNEVKSSQGCTIKADMDFDEATDRLDEWDVVVIPGGGTQEVLSQSDDNDDDDDNKAEPIGLIKAWAALQRKDPSKERTLFSVCTGSLLLARAGVLQGLAATTHPDYYTQLEILCAEAARADTGVGTDVQEERYVVNNARFDLGDDIEENPFIFTRRPDIRRKSSARKGSDAFRASKRRESLLKRVNMPLGGLRVITSGGVTAGLDAALYLVAALVTIESAQECARIMQFNWSKGVTVEGVDV